MSAETSRVASKGDRTRSLVKARRRGPRAGALRRLALDALEPRTLLAVLPASTFATGTVPVSEVTGAGNQSAPSIAIDQNNPLKMAAAWTRNDPNLAPGPTEIVEFAVSNDGGKSWLAQGQPGGFSFPASFDPTTTSPVVLFPQYSDASVAFDRNDNLYVLYSGHRTDNSVGVLLLSKYNFSTGTLKTTFSNKEVYKWVQDPASSPTLAVDDSVASFSDKDINGATRTQNDQWTGNVYVSWTSTDVAPAFGPNNYDPNRIRLVASSDGGNTFSGIQVVNNNGNFGPNRPVTPRISVSQGTGQSSDSTDPRNKGTAAGQVTVVWDDYGVGATASPPYDIINTDRVTNGAVGQTFSANPGPITDAGPGTPNSPATTPFNVQVGGPTAPLDPRFTTVTDVTVDLGIIHPAIQELRIVLQPPAGSGLSPITLLANQQDAAGNSNNFIGANGANLGIAPDGEDIGTVFDDNATRNIVDINNTGGRGAAAPFVGHFQAEGGSLNGLYAGATAAQITGQWTISITDFRNNNVGFVQHARITFNSGFSPGVDTQIPATLNARAVQSGGQINSPAATLLGIAPTPVVVSDNTLGAFSPHEGRLYVAYADRNRLNGNPADNTDIYLSFSDDGGVNWSVPHIVNTDSAVNDGFSEGSLGGNTGRAQFQPNVAVDNANGTVVLSWYDARFDADRARVTTVLTTSIDGGSTFSPNVYANDSQSATDAITGRTVVLEPIPDNQSGVNAEPTASFGTRQGLAVYGGLAHPAWSSNQNGGGDAKQPLGIRTNTMAYAAGPRVVAITQGPVGLPGDPVNGTTAPDGTPVASAFIVTFDRPVDPATFSPTDVRVYYRDTTPNNATGGFVPVNTVVPIVPDPANPNPFGVTQFQVNFAPRNGVGTYSLEVTAADIRDAVRTVKNVVTNTGAPVTTPASDVPKTIGPTSTVTSTVAVAGFAPGQVVAGVKVNIGSISAPDASSLTLTLISPAGTRILLANHEPAPNTGGTDYFGTVFDDSAAQSISAGSAPFTGSFQPRAQLTQLVGQQLNGPWTLEVRSTLTPTTAKLNSWSLTLQAGVVTQAQNPGNKLDQNANAIPGQANDYFATPTPVNPTAHPANVPPAGPFLSDTLPLIIPGPHVASSSVPNTPSTPDNLVLDASVSAIDVVFDRDMNPASIVTSPNTTVLRIMGPTGPINGPFTIEANPDKSDPNPANPRTYRIHFPAQTLSGTYTVTLAATITDARGNALDTNLNAGVDLRKGTVTNATQTTTYTNATALTIPDTKTVVSSINVPDSFLAQGLTVQLDIAHANDPDLQVTLISPQNTSVLLIPRGTGTTGTKANFQSTVFDDAAKIPLSSDGPPFFGRYLPATPLSAVNGESVNGTWRLVVDDNPANPNGIGGRLNKWSISFQTGTPSNGLGEPVADQATVSFRIFNVSPTNRLSSTTWTSVGPASSVDASGTATNNGYSGRVGAIAVDPSDPSGNTVYIGGASGGVWRTTNFLTTDPNGPTYIPLTDFGPTSGLNIGSIAVFPRNNDPRQSIIIAGTGDADTAYGGSNTPYDKVRHGVGFLRSMDGGATWQLLDSTNNSLPFAARDHRFSVGTTNGFFGTGTEVAKVVIDPHPTPSGGVIIYAAVKSPFASNDGGLWRSVDAGTTWQKVSDNSLGDASDVILDYNSATVDAVSNPTGNVNIIYAAFPGSGVYISPNRGQVLNRMAGGNVDPLIIDTITQRQVPVNNGANAPTGFPGSGRIVLAKPNPLPSSANRADVANTLYEGWLYAAVAGPFGTLDGVWMTKDNGQTWTQLHIYTLPDNGLVPRRAVPTNDGFTNPDYDVLASRVFQHGNYDLALTVDPTNPNIVYLGGTADGNVSGLIRIDATRVYDSHAVVSYDGTHFDVGAPLQIQSTGRAQVDNTIYGPSVFVGTSGAVGAVGPYINLIQDPTKPFQTNATVFVRNVSAFTNDGSGVRWTPLDQMLQSNATDAVPSSNVHRMVSYVDPLTGRARLIVGDDQGVFSAVINPDGTLNPGVGTAVAATYSRNGNLATEQYYYGAAQPSTTVLNGQLDALFYGNGVNIGQTASDPNILTNGNTVGKGSTNGSPLGIISVTSGDQAGTGVGTDQQGNNIVYRYYWPLFGGNGTDFFQVKIGNGPFISRTQFLVQTANDPQWPGQSPVYANGLTFGNFAVNPINGNQVMISSAAGRVFSTTNAGQFWLSIGEPGALDGSYAPALTFGSPDPNGPAGIGNLNNFLYAGTVNGNIFVTQTGGGTYLGGNAWTKISTGLDGSPVVKIIANPNRGSHEAYAVTQKGVYHIADSLTGLSWDNITGNLFSLNNTPFGNAGLSQLALSFLTSLQADWRYVIPNDPKGPNPTGTHPILYASGDSGVYRSIDNGATWAPFPNTAFDGSPADGGYLPNVQVNDLTMALGKVDPTSGRAIPQAGDPNVLLATTFGRGQFMIRLAPDIFPATVALDTKLPAPNGSVSGKDAQGRPIVTISQPVIDGLGEQTAFGNTVRITILDLTDPANPRVIGGYDPSQGGAGGNPTDVPANWTDSTGHFQVQVSPTGFTSNGVKTIGVQATDASGTQGNIATLTFVLNAKLVSTTAPAAPTLGLNPPDDTSGGLKITRKTNPGLIGTTDPAVTVTLYLSSVVAPGGGNLTPPNPPINLGTTTTDASGSFSFTLPTLPGYVTNPDGTYTLYAVATNPNNGLSTNGKPYSFTIKTVGPTMTPGLTLAPADDTGVVGDQITSVRRPHFVNTATGKADPGSIVSIYQYKPGGNYQPSDVLATSTAAADGTFSVQLPYALSDGTIQLVVGLSDPAGNTGKFSSPLTATIQTVVGDYTGLAATTPGVFRRNGNGAGVWYINGVTPPQGTVFGGARVDVPFTGDFDGDGRSDLALYRPSTNTWIINRTSTGVIDSFTLGNPGGVPAVGKFETNGFSEPAVYDPVKGTWTIATVANGTQTPTFKNPSVFTPQAGDVPVPGNYAGDTTPGVVTPDQLAVYRPSTGQFFIKGSGVAPGGFDNITVVDVKAAFPEWNSRDVPVPGNYDDAAGFRKTEAAVFDPATGTYYVAGPAGEERFAFSPGDVPAPGDYDGVGRAEPAVYHTNPATGATTFVVNNGGTTKTYAVAGSVATDIPLTAPLYYRNIVASTPTIALELTPFSDTGFVGDGITANHHPFFVGRTEPNTAVDLIDGYGTVMGSTTSLADGTFRVQSTLPNLPNGTYGFRARAHGPVSHEGPVSDPAIVRMITVPGDYLGVAASQPALYRRTSATDAQWFVQGVTGAGGTHFGQGGTDIPIAADADADGKTDLLFYRPSEGTWYVERAATGYTPETYRVFGNPGDPNDIPVPADYLGFGRTVVALFRPATGQFFLGGQPSPTVVVPPQAGDVPVPGDYDNVGRAEFAIFRPSTGQWVVQGPGGLHTYVLGTTGDIPVPGSYDATAGNLAVEPAVWRPSTHQYFIRTPDGGTRTLTFAAGDIPAPGDYEGTGRTEAAVYRPGDGHFYVVTPGQGTPHQVPGQSFVGAAGDIPILAPYAYRALSGSVGAMRAPTVHASGVDLGTTARSFSLGTGGGATSATATPAPSSSAAPVIDLSSRLRPRQQSAHRPSPGAHRLALHAHHAATKGRRLPG